MNDTLTTPEDGMKITRDTVLKPGVYFLPNGIEIAADHVTLDGNGAVLVGAGFAGRGVWATQKTGIIIRNVTVERYYHGIWVNACANVQLIRNTATRTHEIAGQDVFLDVWLDRSEAYGAGIFCGGVLDGVLADNDVQHQQNGIMLYGCNALEIVRNNASFNSGYGVLLFESSQNTLSHNIADYCCRMYHTQADGKKYHNGADAAAIVMMCSSSKNIVAHNLLRNGGDGVFLGGFHKDQIKVPCNDNVFEHNDASFSPNIAFEATFSERNVFRNNKADKCKIGFWLGYSSHNVVEDNSIKDCWSAGVAIEHGHHNTISGNVFERNREGVQLWVGVRPAFTNYFPECAESHETAIKNNRFSKHDFAVRCWTPRSEDGNSVTRCHHFTINDNEMTDNRIAIQLERVRESRITGNRITNNVEAGIKLVGTHDVFADGNAM